MKLKNVKIKNFRCLVDVEIPLNETTILVGENNSGKTAFLDALKIALPWHSTRKESFFNEYDYHMVKKEDSPETSEGIVIELWFQEDKSDEWPDELFRDLTEIIQTDPVKDIDAIGLRISSQYDSIAKNMVDTREFLNLTGEPLGGKGAKSGNFAKFLRYVRLFYLSAMRDASSEFSPRSQFWGRILRDLKIDDKERKKFTTELERINQKLLKADSRLEEVRKSIAKAQQIMMLAEDGGTDIQALPAKPWDLMSKAQVVIRGRGTEVDLPLSRHGQGMQSLSVLFLFQAYLDVLLKPQFREETTAILALEEPEAHLHPHASRCLALMLGGIKSQKIISSHSPFFVQEIPFEQIRLFRSLGSETKVLYIKNSFCADLPSKQDLINFCATKNKFTYDQDRKRLTIRGKIEQQEYRDLLTIYAQKREIHPIIKKLYDESQVYLTEDEIAALYTYAKRIRGEILFARGWFLCEGQSEYLLIRYFSELLGKPLDQCGITVIDFMNNGSASAFIGLAKVFEMPWYMLCDNDSAGEKYVEEVRNRGIDEEGIKKYVRTLDGENETLESFLANNGFLDECVEVLRKRDKVLSKRPCEEGFKVELIKELQRDKVGNITTLISILRKKNINKTRVPDLFKDAINTIVKMVNEDGK